MINKLRKRFVLDTFKYLSIFWEPQNLILICWNQPIWRVNNFVSRYLYRSNNPIILIKLGFIIIAAYLVNGCRTNEKEKIKSLIRIEFNFLAGSNESVISFDNWNFALVLLCNWGRRLGSSRDIRVLLSNLFETYIRTNFTVDDAA